MPKYVLSQGIDAFEMTNRSNYYAYVQDVRKKMRFPKSEFRTREEVIAYAEEYLNIPPDRIEFPKY